MENPGLTISPCEVLNPATLLPIPEGSLPFHSCLETLDHWTKPQEGLSEDPLTNPGEIWYTDGSSFVLDGKRRAGYAVASNFETIEAKPLSPAVKVPGHDSWIHYSRVKLWKKTEEDTQYTCEPLGDLRYLFRTTSQPATTCSASSTRIYKTTANHGKYYSSLIEHRYKDSEA